MMKVAKTISGWMHAILQKRFTLVLVLAGMQGLTAPLLAASVHPGCSSGQHCSDGASCETWTSGSNRTEQCVIRADGIAVVFAKANYHPEYQPGVKVPVSAIEVTGVITIDKVARVRQIMAKYRPVLPQGVMGAWFTVMIDSPGGDVYAAMELGRLFRANQVGISLDRWNDGHAQCASACILAWAGAPMRLLGGMPGDDRALVIHRPYGFADAERDFADSSDKWKTLQADIRQYLSEMNIPPTLLDAMNEVSLEDGRALTPAELSKYLLSVEDPAYSELYDASEARKRGISRMEYLSRKRRVAECVDRLSHEASDPISGLLSCNKLYDIAADASLRATPP